MRREEREEDVKEGDEEEDEEEDEYGERVDSDDDDDEDDDEGEGDGRSGKKRKVRRHGVNRFVDVEAVVDDDEEEFDDEDTELLKEGESVFSPCALDGLLTCPPAQTASSSRMRGHTMRITSGGQQPRISCLIYRGGEMKRWMQRRLLPSCERGTAISEA